MTKTLPKGGLALSLMFVATALAQTLPTTPPSGYDQSGRFPAGTIQWNISYYSSVAGRNLAMHVYISPGYRGSQKYGVVYCYQGIGDSAHNIFTDTYIRANIVADNLIGPGQIKPVIVVALDDQFNGNSSDVSRMRIRDAVPYVDSHFSTYADADHRGVYRYSWGGGKLRRISSAGAVAPWTAGVIDFDDMRKTANPAIVRHPTLVSENPQHPRSFAG